jgi:hypothetical protein
LPPCPWTATSRAYGLWVRNNAIFMSTNDITYLVAVCAGVFGFALYVGLIVVPAWGSYSRVWERIAATILSLYVLGVLVGAGVLAALLAVFLWG